MANYFYDPTMPDDSLKMLAVATEYDLGGKVISVVKYPYGIKGSSKHRNVIENYMYDRLGRVSRINTKNGNASSAEIVHYEYYPNGSVKTVTLGNSLTLTYTYHISGAVKTATVQSADGKTLYAETLHYEDCDGIGCTPQYNGNISRMVHELAHGNDGFAKKRDVRYTYDLLNRLTGVNDVEEDYFNEYFAYDDQGRIVTQRRAGNVGKSAGGEYTYEAGSNKLKSVTNGMGGTADSRNMTDANNFDYDADGNLIEDKSKHMKVSYDWRGMPVEFIRETGCYDYHGHSLCDTTKLSLAYDGSGRRISKTRSKKSQGGTWWTELVTHYTGLGTEIRENPLNGEAKVVVNLPNGLGRYMPEDASAVDIGFGAGYIPSEKFEWYLKNHLGSTMLVYGTQGYAWTDVADVGVPVAAYDYRAFGEQVSLAEPAEKVTENFTGKERDDETELDYFGARYLDPMLGMWTSVDPKRQFASPYLYAGNGYNPVNGVDGDGGIIHLANNQMQLLGYINQISATQYTLNERNELIPTNISKANGAGSQYYSDRLNAAIESSDVLEVLVGSADETYLNNYTGNIECGITGEFNQNSSPAQNLLHELVGHGIPIMLDDRDPTASAVEEERKAVDGIFPVDVPDHMIDQRYEE